MAEVERARLEVLTKHVEARRPSKNLILST